MHIKKEKGKFILDHMVRIVSPYVDYTASLGENISLVRKSLGSISRGSTALVPLTAGISQMKLEAPP